MPREPGEVDPSIGFPHNGAMVIVKLSNADDLIKEVMECKDKLQMMQSRLGYFVEHEMLVIIPVKVKTVLPARGGHYFQVVEHAQWNNHDRVEDEDYRYDYNLWVGTEISPEDIFFTLEEAQQQIMEYVNIKIDHHEYYARNARAQLAALEEEFGFKFVPKETEYDRE